MFQNIKDIYKFRALLWALVTRHLSARYRGSIFGFCWSFLNPLCLMLVYTVVFKYYIRFNQVPNYTIFLFCGLLPWIWTTSGLAEGTSSIVGSGHLITKSMFPAHLLPTVSVLTTMINFLLSLPLLFIFMWALDAPWNVTLLAMPVLIVLQFLFILGAVLALGALNVYFRDIQHILGNVLSFLFFLCPIVYPASTVPAKYTFTLELNPFALFTMSYHNLILDGVLPSMHSVVYLCAWSLLSVVVGNMVYNRYREGFAELL